MSLEKILDSIPEKITAEGSDRGFHIRYKVSLKKWIVGYGLLSGAKKDSAEDNPYIGTGYSIIEAVDDFVKNKLPNHKK